MRFPSCLKMSSTPRVFGNGYRIGYRLYISQSNDIILYSIQSGLGGAE
jgi:hypothetical protein